MIANFHIYNKGNAFGFVFFRREQPGITYGAFRLYHDYNQKRLGELTKGGCFKSALESARKFGGVIEHPHSSLAWKHFGIKTPPRKGGWIKADIYGGWTCCIEQGRYGHYARKPTWLLVYGVTHEALPQLDWGHSEHRIPQWAIDKYGIEYCKKAGELAFRGGGKDSKERIATPIPFRDLLIKIAKLSYKEQQND